MFNGRHRTEIQATPIPPRTAKRKKDAEALTGSETVLIAEDDGQVRKMAVKTLERHGYTVLSAANGEEAVDIAETYSGPIHLLLTDVVMSGISGGETAERLKGVRPEIKVLYMSGYTDNTIVHHGALDKGTAFLGKPLTPKALGRKVREVLET